MEIWEIISFLVSKVCEEQNCFLDITITEKGFNMQFMPIGAEIEEGDDDED